MIEHWLHRIKNFFLSSTQFLSVFVDKSGLKGCNDEGDVEVHAFSLDGESGPPGRRDNE